MTHDRDGELKVIEGALTDDKSREFQVLMALYDLDEQRPEHRNVLIKVLKQGRWKTAPDPLKNIRKAVLGQMFSRRGGSERRMGDALGLSAEAIGSLSHRSDTREAVPGVDGVWRQGGGLHAEYEDWINDEGADRLISRVRPEFVRTVDPQEFLPSIAVHYSEPFQIIAWHKVLDQAGLDDFEQSIFRIIFKSNRGQAKAIKEFTGFGYDRNAVLAAIKRVRRKLPEIRKILCP